jgi:hypothetical protein
MKRKHAYHNHFPWLDLAMLGVEAQQVIWLRLMKLSAGGSAAQREAALMVSEKVGAAAIATQKLMLGSSTLSVVRGYRRKVRSNAKRLSK